MALSSKNTLFDIIPSPPKIIMFFTDFISFNLCFVSGVNLFFSVNSIGAFLYAERGEELIASAQAILEHIKTFSILSPLSNSLLISTAVSNRFFPPSLTLFFICAADTLLPIAKIFVVSIVRSEEHTSKFFFTYIRSEERRVGKE